jgi:hypothetical protein
MEAEGVSEPIWTIWRREICLIPTGNRTPIPRSSTPLRILYINWCNPGPEVISDLHYINIAVICLMSYGDLLRGYQYLGGIFRVHLQDRRTFTLQTETASCFDTLLSSYETVVSHKTTVCTCGISQDHSMYLRYPTRPQHVPSVSHKTTVCSCVIPQDHIMYLLYPTRPQYVPAVSHKTTLCTCCTPQDHSMYLLYATRPQYVPVVPHKTTLCTCGIPQDQSM